MAAPSEQAIVNGSNNTGDPSVVAIEVQYGNTNMGALCTGEVIAPHVVLTAAHCAGGEDPSVTSTYHVTRARMLFRRCYHGELRMVGAPQQWWKLPLQALSETAKLGYQMVIQRGC